LFGNKERDFGERKERDGCYVNSSSLSTSLLSLISPSLYIALSSPFFPDWDFEREERRKKCVKSSFPDEGTLSEREKSSLSLFS
jgi:hypothetical protein